MPARRRSNRTARPDWMSVSRPHLARPVAGNDARLIGERAPTRGRSAMGAAD
jgi:hypothetical protein